MMKSARQELQGQRVDICRVTESQGWTKEVKRSLQLPFVDHSWSQL